MKPYFIDRVRTDWLDNHREMRMVEPFAFVDSGSRIWRCRVGDVIDGASIPRLFWITVGSPFCGPYRKASCLHDSAYIHRDGPREAADWMFLEAMEVEGASWALRNRMWVAVRLAGQGAWDSDDAAKRLPYEA